MGSQGRSLSKRMFAELMLIVKSEDGVDEKESKIKELFNFDPELKRKTNYKGYNPKQAEYMRRYRAKCAAIEV